MEKIEKLAKLAQKGDKDAFLQLIEQCTHSLTRAALAILHQEEDAADAVSQTVLTAFYKLSSLEKPQYVKTWLTRILIHNCYNILQKQKRLTPLEQLPEQEDSTPEQPGYRRDKILDIRRSLSQLAENDRLVLTLHYMDDLPVKEIAKLLSVSESAVKTRLMRGRERFRQAYLKGEKAGNLEGTVGINEACK